MMKSENLVTIALVIVIAGLVAYKIAKQPRADEPETITPNASGTSETQFTEIGQFLKDQGFQGHVTALQFGRIDCENSGNDLKLLAGWNRDNEVPGLKYARVEFSDATEAVDKYFEKNDPGFPVIRDPSGKIGQAFGATIIPTFVLIDKYGHVRYRGPVPKKHINTWTEVLAAEEKDPGPEAVMFGPGDVDVSKLLAGTSLPGVDGSPAKPLNKYMGETGLMIVFVDTSCPLAGQAISEIPDTAPVLQAQKINTVLINVNDDSKTVADFYKDKNLGVPVVFDEGATTHVSWNVYSVPRVFVISPKNEVVYSGTAVWKDVFASVQTNLTAKKEPVEPPHKGTGFG